MQDVPDVARCAHSTRGVWQSTQCLPYSDSRPTPTRPRKMKPNPGWATCAHEYTGQLAPRTRASPRPLLLHERLVLSWRLAAGVDDADDGQHAAGVCSSRNCRAMEMLW